MDIEKCKACCKDTKNNAYKILEWDGFENSCKQQK